MNRFLAAFACLCALLGALAIAAVLLLPTKTSAPLPADQVIHTSPPIHLPTPNISSSPPPVAQPTCRLHTAQCAPAVNFFNT
jgi:hypothetical protein